MNKLVITVTGNLGSAPELRHTPRGTATARLRIATTDRKRSPDGTWADGETTWYTIVAWGALAEATTELSKGAPLIVHGRLTHRTFTDNGGAARETWEITAATIGTALRPAPGRPGTTGSGQDEAWEQPSSRRAVPAGRVAARR